MFPAIALFLCTLMTSIDQSLNLGKFSIQVPTSWDVRKENGGAVLSVSGADADASFVVTVGLADKSVKNIEGAMSNLCKDAEGAGKCDFTKTTATNKATTGVPFQVRGAVAKSKDGVVHLLLFALGNGSDFLKIAVIAQSEKAISQASSLVFPFIQGIKLDGVKSTDREVAPSAKGETPSALPKDFGKGVSGIWKGFSSHIGGKGFDCMVLFPDGTMIFRMPAYGLDVLTSAQLKKVYGDYVGRYTYENGVVTIKADYGGKWTYRLDPKGRLESTGDSATASYVKYPLLANAQFEGAYEIATVATNGPSYDPLKLTKDGRFEISSLINLVEVDLSLRRDEVARQRRGGKGRYRIRNCTLHLMFDDGRHIVTSIELGTGENATNRSPKTLILNRTAYSLR